MAALPLGATALLGAEVQLARLGTDLPSTPPHRLDGIIGDGDGDRPPTRVVWLGDSTAAGVGASVPAAALPRQVAQRAGYPVSITSLSVSGARVADVLHRQVPRMPPEPVDVVFISVGANDAVHLTPRGSFRRDYRALLAAMPHGARVVVLGVPDMGAVTRFTQPLRSVVGWRGRAVDTDVKHATAAAGATYVDIARATGPAFRRDPGRYFAADHFHPDDAGYGLWADAVARTAGP